MPIGLLKEIYKDRPAGALLGLDVGKKTIGLALSDPGQGMATPLQTIKRTKFSRDMEALQTIALEFEVAGFVIGLPVSMDGTEGRRAQSVRDFGMEMFKSLQESGTSPWIAFWDERLSTVSVEELVGKFVDKRKTRAQAKESGLIDKLAAQVILQGALDFLQKT